MMGAIVRSAQPDAAGSGMVKSPLGLHESTPAELRERLTAERRGTPFLIFRGEAGTQQIVELPDARARMSIGRGSTCDVALPWDPEVSRLHAELEHAAGQWLIVDDGLS